ncbi:glycoside hydrolase family 88 protein [Lutibacter citreus]|uniref:glycoside hydrolase family 88 protein n=1 Tax=Lutibacter citreus TaxID=2138210 RepID=UPI000DBEAAAF|nr:glycoside hydrolase family 88 protein [Lutibacter citreus]
MKTLKQILLVLICSISLISCKTNSQKKGPIDKELLSHIDKQLTLLVSKSLEGKSIPRTVKDGEIRWSNPNWDWTEGFFPGTLWYLYKTTNDEKWKDAAEQLQAQFEDHKYKTTQHDVGFVFNCSYGNGYRLTKNESFKQVMITAGDSLITRFNPVIKAIQSWDVDKGWQAERGWKFPVIIDNMMNLELLFELSKITGDPKYSKVAIAHANTTLKNHFRDDYSSFHMIDYDPETGNVRSKQTVQGYKNESSWSRGQSWGLYGYTLCYRYTKDEKYLKQAEGIAKYIMNHKNLPADGIPYWDYYAPNIPNEPRDASAAALAASALIELDKYSKENYAPFIDKILTSLSSDKYLAEVGENNFFLLKHSVGSIPHGEEIDVPLNYADYYYIEALIRRSK